MKAIQLLCLVLAIPLISTAQPEAYNWYFGDQFGLNFSSGEPVAVTESAIRTRRGSATVSDAEGNLLFYTNGGRPLHNPFNLPGKIWNRNHEVMHDMGLLLGGSSRATQSSLILPKPGQDSVYLLFTMEGSNWNGGPNGPPGGFVFGRGLRYYEIDMRLNDGLGGLNVTNRRLHTPAIQALTGTLHADGERYWVLAIDWTENSFIRLLVDGSNIMSPTDVELVPIPFSAPLFPEIKISPDGKWIAFATRLMRFDNATGVVSNVIVDVNGLSYGSTFSPEGRYYYFLNGDAIERVDLTAPDILASLEVMLPKLEQDGMGTMQLGPFGRIYFSTYDQNGITTIGEIRCPDDPNPMINEELLVIPLVEEGQLRYAYGLPNFADHIFLKTPNRDTLPPENLTFCQGDEIILKSRITNPTYQYEWSNGSTAEEISISEGGTYYLNIIDECGVTTYDQKNVVMLSAPSLAFDEPPLDKLCEDETYTLNLLTDPGNDIIWSTGEESDSILLFESTNLSVTVSNECGMASAEFTAEFVPCLEDCELIFPDIISPNGDGINDTFGGFNNCVPSSYELQVYNRWGKLVFKSNNVDNFWDGRLNGNLAPSDIYLYQAQYRFAETQDFKTAKGQLTVVR